VAFAEADDQLEGWQGSQQDLRAMWDSVPRPLLRVGKAGVKLHLRRGYGGRISCIQRLCRRGRVLTAVQA